MTFAANMETGNHRLWRRRPGHFNYALVSKRYGTWGELQIEYLRFKKKEDDEHSQGNFGRENVLPDLVSITMVKKDLDDKGA